MMIKVEGLNFAYDEELVLKDISLNVPEGSFFGILGPNGSGKTTLIKVLAGILPNKCGVIKIDGRPVEEYTRQERARLIAIVPQDTVITFPFSAIEIVLMGRAPYLKQFGFETKKDIEIARSAMELTDTWQFRTRKMSELSGGERQRVIIARALAQEPKILLLDEPTAFLDIRHQNDIIRIISRLQKENKLTVLSVLHDLNLATLCCQTIAFIKGGSIFITGRPEEVVTYANIKSVFETDVYVGINDFTGMPYYIPAWERKLADD